MVKVYTVSGYQGIKVFGEMVIGFMVLLGHAVCIMHWNTVARRIDST